MKGDGWLPKLGDMLSGQGQELYGSVERRFEEVGFSLQLTLNEQSPSGLGDKNNEERKLQNAARGAPKMDPKMEQQGSTYTHSTPTAASNTLAEIQALQAKAAAMGIPISIPIHVTVDPKLVTESLRGAQPTFGQDLGRFSAKAGIVTVLALSGAVAYHFITKPAEPGIAV